MDRRYSSSGGGSAREKGLKTRRGGHRGGQGGHGSGGVGVGGGEGIPLGR
jgi:hypothetical protein